MSRRHSKTMIGLALASLAFGQGAAAQEQDDTAEAEARMAPVLVRQAFLASEKFSATKTPTPIIDVPQSLSIVSIEQIEEQAFFSVGDVLRYTPGASIGQGEGHRDQVTIRGQNTTADFFIDGLRDDVQYFRSFYNLRQIEVLRGANALMFGRGGGGGVINRVTKTPEREGAFLAGTASVNSFGSAFVSADANTPVGEQSAVRFNAFYEDLANHRDAFEGERFASNPTIRFDVSPDTRLQLSYEYVNDDRLVDRGVPSVGGAPLEGFDETFFGDPDANRTTLEASIARARIDHTLSPSWAMNATVQFADYDKFYRNLYPVGFAPATGTVSLDGYSDVTDRQNLIAQANLIGEANTGPLKHLLLFGVEYGDQQTDNSRQDIFFEDSQDDQVTFLFTDPLSIPAFSFPAFNRDRSSDVEFASIYVQDQVDIGDRLKLIAGLRYDKFDIGVVDRIEANDGSADGNDGLMGRSDGELSPRIGLIYKPVPNMSLYASYSESFLPRSGDQFLTLSLTSEALDPERFENVELGAKWDITPDLSLTTSVFQLDRDAGTTVDPDDASRTILIGSLTEGFEVQLSGQLTDRLAINGGYSYLDASEDGRVIDGLDANRSLSQVPEHMAFVWSRFEVTDQLAVGLGANHQSEQFASISNAVELPSFTRVDAALFYDVSDRFQVQFNVENLLDEDGFTDAHNDNNITPAAPLNARLTVRARF